MAWQCWARRGMAVLGTAWHGSAGHAPSLGSCLFSGPRTHTRGWVASRYTTPRVPLMSSPAWGGPPQKTTGQHGTRKRMRGWYLSVVQLGRGIHHIPRDGEVTVGASEHVLLLGWHALHRTQGDGHLIPPQQHAALELLPSMRVAHWQAWGSGCWVTSRYAPPGQSALACG